MGTFAITSLKDVFIHCKRAFWYAALFSLCINILMLALPLYSLQVLDRVMSSHSMETLHMLTLITIACFIFYGLFNLVRSFVLTRVGDWMDEVLAPLLLENSVARSAVGTATSASQHHRDLYIIKGFISGQGATTLFDAPWALIFLLVIYAINPVLGFVTLLGCVLLLIFAVFTELSTRKPLKLASGLSIHSMGIAETASRNAEAIEAMGMMRNITHHWQGQNAKSIRVQNVAASRSAILQNGSRIIRMVLQISLTGFGAYLALQNEVTVGGMIASSILAARALAPFEASIAVWKNFVNARDAYARLEQSITTTPQLRGTMPLPAPKGDLTIENMFYRAPGNEKPILKAINMRLSAGESLGIIGPSAAGKSTLAKLIIGVLPPSHGSVRLDAVEIFKWNREDLGSHVGYMPQQVELFAGTVKDNIARMDLNATPEAVIAAAQMAGVHEMILRLPKGYETTFSANDLSLSPGQRQRIGLARALYGSPKFVVLDEPNSNLDGEGERALVDALTRMKAAGITFIVVAHRPSIVGSVDKILTLRDGAIEQFGPRQQVLQKYVQPPAPQVAAAAAAIAAGGAV